MILNTGGDDLKNICNICGASQFIRVLEFEKAVFSDGYVIDTPLIKEECQVCGTVRTNLEVDLYELYKKAYTPSRDVDTIAFQDNQAIKRSEFVYRWISDLVGTQNIKNFSSILEIGCGQGFLIEKFPCRLKHGVEPNIKAYERAKKVANVRNIGYEEIQENEKYDFVYSYCVIEHVRDPRSFLKKIYSILSPNGKVCIGLPIQDKFNYDLFFADHIHHFSHKNFVNLFNSMGFSIISYELGRGSYSNIGVYLCEKTKASPNAKLRFEYIRNKNIENTKTILSNIDYIMKSYKNKVLYAFGYGEIAKTILPYTGLDRYIQYYIDDFTEGSKVISSKKAKEIFNKTKRVNLILLVNPMHVSKVISLFKEFNNINFINIFDGIEVA